MTKASKTSAPSNRKSTPGILSRRSVLAGVLAASGVSRFEGAEPAEPINAGEALKINDLDRRIWREELDSFVPSRIYDMHSHLTRREFDLDRTADHSVKTNTLASGIFKRNGSLELREEVDSVLYPGREVRHLLMPNPHQKCDFEGSNAFIAAEARKKPGTEALMLVHPSMTEKEVDQSVARRRFLGFKPYRRYSITGDIDECRITDFLPDHQIAVANRYGLIIGLHLSKKRAIADEQNLGDLERLTGKYPRVRWILYHCARSYSDWALKEAAPRLRQIPNLWFESSSVCETDAFYALFSSVDLSSVCHGTDDLPVGVTRGKYVSWGYAWSQMDALNQTLNKTHCDGRLTFVRYEMLRAMARAARYLSLSRDQVEGIFYHNAARLVASARRDLDKALGPQSA